jgi:hypothetical protein
MKITIDIEKEGENYRIIFPENLKIPQINLPLKQSISIIDISLNSFLVNQQPINDSDEEEDFGQENDKIQEDEDEGYEKTIEGLYDSSRNLLIEQNICKKIGSDDNHIIQNISNYGSDDDNDGNIGFRFICSPYSQESGTYKSPEMVIDLSENDYEKNINAEEKQYLQDVLYKELKLQGGKNQKKLTRKINKKKSKKIKQKLTRKNW